MLVQVISNIEKLAPAAPCLTLRIEGITQDFWLEVYQTAK